MANGFQGKEGQQMPVMPEEFVNTVTERYIELYELLTGQQFNRTEADSSPDVIYNKTVQYLKR